MYNALAMPYFITVVPYEVISIREQTNYRAARILTFSNYDVRSSV